MLSLLYVSHAKHLLQSGRKVLSFAVVKSTLAFVIQEYMLLHI